MSRYRPVSDTEASALSLAVVGIPFPAICEELLSYFNEQETHLKATGYLQTWVQDGLITALNY